MLLLNAQELLVPAQSGSGQSALYIQRLGLIVVLPSSSEPCGQALRQIGGKNFFLRYPQVVRHAIVSHDPGFGIEHSKRSAPVAIAGLAYGAGINEIAAVLS